MVNVKDGKKETKVKKPVVHQKRGFYGKEDFMSNFHSLPCPIVKGSKTYKTSEHFYQAEKYPLSIPGNEVMHGFICAQETPAKAQCAARGRGGRWPWQNQLKELSDIYLKKGATFDPHWDTKKLDVMREALKLKFDTNPILKKELLDTGHVHLVEVSPYDAYWGIGKNGDGENWLGKLLMEYRDAAATAEEDMFPANEPDPPTSP